MKQRAFLILLVLSASSHHGRAQVPPRPSPFDARRLSMAEYPFVTQHATDSVALALGKLAAKNVDSLAIAERRVFDQSGSFSVDSAELRRAGYQPMPGLNVRIVTGSRWFVIDAAIPRIVSIALTAVTATDAGPVSNASLWTWPDDHARPRKP
jgi:hypothetical protein